MEIALVLPSVLLLVVGIRVVAPPVRQRGERHLRRSIQGPFVPLGDEPRDDR